MSEPAFTHDVFLSHTSKDKVVVRAVAEHLRRDGLKVWLDEWAIKAGDSIPAKIEEGLEHSCVLGRSALRELDLREHATFHPPDGGVCKWQSLPGKPRREFGFHAISKDGKDDGKPSSKRQ